MTSDYCNVCGKPKLYPEKPCFYCEKNKSDENKASEIADKVMQDVFPDENKTKSSNALYSHSKSKLSEFWEILVNIFGWIIGITILFHPLFPIITENFWVIFWTIITTSIIVFLKVSFSKDEKFKKLETDLRELNLISNNLTRHC